MGCNPIPPSYGLLPLYGFHPLLSTMVSRGVFKMRAQGFVVLLYVFSLVHLSVGQLVIICYYIIWVYLDLICFPVKQKQESFCSVSLLTNQRENQTGNQTTYTAKVWKGKTTSFRKFQELSKTTMQNRSVRVLNSGRCVAFSRPGLDHDLLRDASVMWTKTANTEEKARASKEKAGCEACNRIWEAVWISNFKTACISDSANAFLYSVLAIYGEALVLWPVIVCGWCNLEKNDDWQEKKQMRHLMMNRGFYFIYLSFLRFQQIRH